MIIVLFSASCFLGRVIRKSLPVAGSSDAGMILKKETSLDFDNHVIDFGIFSMKITGRGKA